jgi:hypothetical protein
MKKMIGTDNEATAKAMVKSFDQRMNMKARHVLDMKDYDVEVKSELCSQYFYFSVYYAYPEKDLSDLFTERNNDDEDFAHEELLQMFYEISDGILSLHKKDAKREIGVLQMNKIFWDDESNTYNVVENFLNKKINEIYMTMVLARNPFAIICPEILVRNKQTFETVNRLKVDAFNLGMILLCMGLGIKPGKFYNIKYNKLNSELLEKSIQEFKTKYHENPLLVSILNDLLVEEPLLRMDLQKVNEKYPTQDQVSVFLKSNSHVSTDIDRTNSKNQKIQAKSMSYNSSSYQRANSFQNPHQNSPFPVPHNPHVNRSHNQQANYHKKQSLRTQTMHGIRPANHIKPSNFSNTLPTGSKNHFPFIQKKKINNYNQTYGNVNKGYQPMYSPQMTPTQPKAKVNRNLMSMGNIKSPQYGNGNGQRQFRYPVPSPGNGQRNSTELNRIMKQGDADFFNS